jgi:DnaJ-class molecular chaperone
MSITNPYKILGVPVGSSIEEVKKVYKSIALKSHPDKLNNISDVNERNIKIKEFVDATNAYNKILKGDVEDYSFIDEDFDFENYNFTFDDWEETINSIRQSDLFKDIVSMIMKFKSKIKKHNINVDIKYSDYFSNNKKKLRLFLKGIDEPVYINLDCKKYPSCIINYFDDNDNEHEINIKMELINDPKINNGYYHEINDNSINLYYDIPITTVEYLIGNVKEIIFINKEKLQINIEPFSKELEIKGYGINNADLIIKLIYNPIEKENWYKLTDADRNEMVRILKNIKNDIKI